MTGKTFYHGLQLASLLLTSLLAFRLGSRTEKIGAAILLAAGIPTILILQSDRLSEVTVNAALVVIDTLALLAFVNLALRSRKFWPLWGTSILLIAVTKHLVVFLQLRATLQPYTPFHSLWMIPVMLLIILGSLRDRRR
ncbi:hypothetical protein [Sandaracinobacteroides saxicola]|uniref:Uncharacterized protein n=1 Tax=Sandaracinobacteroides saxicola TaxID=2759707 RepID=A0A7G5IFH8_9SPHN|nr:hypothetical protein [Sandaracinobacteroides saxicola]QMW22120.1 hypothetical protein H3309_12175 [Sandaracinobacteroides saxicola]